jgi:hypothetical protein
MKGTPVNLDPTVSQQLRDDIQPIYEKVCALLGAEHEAAESLLRTSNALAAASTVTRRYGEYQPKGAS